MKLPSDRRVFTDSALALIQSGKFERGLARRMPQVLAEQAKVLEIGSAVGFLAGHCANIRPDLSLYLQEDNPALRKMLDVVCALSNRTFNDRFVVMEQGLGSDPVVGALALITALRPDALLLSDSQLGTEVLQKLLPMLPVPAPKQIFLYGRLLEQHHARLPEIEDVLTALGYVPDYGFDANIARGFRRCAPADPDGPS